MKRTLSIVDGPPAKKLRRTRLVRRAPLASLVKRIIHNSEERKYVDSPNAQTISASGVVVPLNNIAEGTDFNQRVGRKVQMMYADIRIHYDGDATAIAATVWLVLDRQPNGTAAAFSDIFTSSGFRDLEQKNVASNSKRFKILSEHHLPDPSSQYNTSTSAPLGIVGQLKMFHRLPEGSDSIVDFGGSSAAVPNTNAVYLVFATSGSSWGFTYNPRIAYVDL